ncbi:MAG: hypothetical protein ACOH2N_00515 [Devosia sp.]
MKSTASLPAETKFSELLKAPPTVEPSEIGKLNELVAQFQKLHHLSNDRSGEDAAWRNEKTAQAALDRQIVLNEAGMATPAQVQEARDKHATAAAALESFPRRKTVMATELRSLQDSVKLAAAGVNASLSDWQRPFGTVSDELAGMAVNLLFLAAAAGFFAGDHPHMPDDRQELLSWLSNTRHFALGHGHSDYDRPEVPGIVIAVRQALSEASSVASQVIPAPAIAQRPAHHLHSRNDQVHSADFDRAADNA